MAARTLLLAGASTCIATLLAAKVGLPILQRLQVGQTVREDGPKSHFRKSGTPLFGGLFFAVPLLLVCSLAVYKNPQWKQLGLLAIWIFFSAAIGFADDYIKVRVDRRGLSPRRKTIWLLFLNTGFVGAYLFLMPDPPMLLLPFSQNGWLITGWWRLLYGLFLVIYLYFVVNAVNLNDGIDGLCASVTLIVGIAIGLAALLLIARVPAAEPIPLLCAATVGGCLGFIPFNRHPARVFMGDTGSFTLGAVVAGAAMFAGVPWIVLLAGIIYVVEALSVVIQVLYFKKTGGKRIFRMSPIHHHFELGGWSENKIVYVFSVATLVGSLLALVAVC